MKDKLLLIFLTTLVAVRIITSWQNYQNGQFLHIRSRVTTEPIYYDYTQLLNIRGIRIYLDRFPQIKYGDWVEIKGEYEEGKLMEAKLLDHQMSTNPFHRLRDRIISFYKSTLPEPHASLVAGMALGSRSGIPQKFWDQLVTTGTAHVVVASGANIALVASFLLMILTSFINRRKALIIVFAFIWIYTLMVGFDAPIIRAAIMGTIAFTGELLGRIRNTFRILLLSALLMLLVWPQWITDYGFLLSFGATASLLLFSQKIYKQFKFVPGIIREDLSTSLAAQIVVAPMLLLMFGRVSLVSPIVNALVLWTVAPLTIIGMISGIVGLLVPFMGKLILFSSYPLAEWFVRITKLFS